MSESINKHIPQWLTPKIGAALVSVLAVYFLFPTFYDSGVWPLPSNADIWTSIDPSWMLGLGYAKAKSLTWGNDVVFTYGPLSYITHRISMGAGKYGIFIYDIFLSCNLFFAFYVSIVHSQYKRLTLFIVFTILYVTPAFIGSGNSVLLLMLLVFWIRQSMDKPNHLNLTMQVLIATLLFFVKFNTGLISLIFLLFSFTYLFFYHKSFRLITIVYFQSALLIITFGCLMLQVSLMPYIMGGINLITGYNDIMYLDGGFENKYNIELVLLVMSNVLLMWICIKSKQQMAKQLLILFLFGVSSFVVYKQASTRMDIQHISEFYFYFPFLILAVHDFHFIEKNYVSTIVVTMALLASILFVKREGHKEFITLKSRLTKPDYFNRLKYCSDSSGIFLFPNQNQFPERILKRLNNERVDVYPWNIQMLVENRLNCALRPVFQSYSAYNKYLENLNYNFYQSVNAPRFVIYENVSVDNRYALFDEPKVQMQYAINYLCVDTFTYANRLMMLLERKQPAKQILFTKHQEYEMNFTDEIFPKDSIYYEIHIEKTLKNKFRSIWAQSPELYLQILKGDSSWHEFKTSSGLLESGLFSTIYQSNTNEVFYAIKGDSIPQPHKVFTYGLRSAKDGMFKDRIKVIEYRITTL